MHNRIERSEVPEIVPLVHFRLHLCTAILIGRIYKRARALAC